MKFKPIIIIAGEPNSIFFEILLKIIKKNKFKSPIILICSKKILIKQSKALRENIKFKQLYENQIYSEKVKLYKLNLIDVEYDQSKTFQKISLDSNKYIKKCFDIGLSIMKKGISQNSLMDQFLKNIF